MNGLRAGNQYPVTDGALAAFYSEADPSEVAPPAVESRCAKPPARWPQEHRVILVAAALHGEGTSTVARQLTAQLDAGASRGALLVDANLRLPQQHDAAGVPREQGLAELLAGSLEPLEAVRPAADFHLMTAGAATDTPNRLLDRQLLAEQVEQLRCEFDYVVLDAPPITVYSDATELGGEDRVFAAEAELLETRGHRVIRYTRDNDEITALGIRGRVAIAGTTIWSRRTYSELLRLVRAERVDVAHFHNTLPLISPSGYYAARAAGAAVVQTLHNFRIACPGGALFRAGRLCEDCLGRAIPWPAVRYGCYRHSRAASAVVGAMTAFHRGIGTWTDAVDAYVALTETNRRKLIQAGLPADRIQVKPNFIFPQPTAGTGDGGFALYVGRLAPEKGISTLLDAWDYLHGVLGAEIPLKIAGAGPMQPLVREAACRMPWIEPLGEQSRAEVLKLMQEAAFLVMPSLGAESFPVTLAEAGGSGLPALVSGHGALLDIVDDGVEGLHFRPGDAVDLADKVRWCIAHPSRLDAMRRSARLRFETRYTAARSYRTLMHVYDRARARFEATSAAKAPIVRKLSAIRSSSPISIMSSDSRKPSTSTTFNESRTPVSRSS